MQKLFMCLLSCAMLTGLSGIAAENPAVKPEEPGKAAQKSGEAAPGFRGRSFGGRAFQINYGYNDEEKKIVSAEEAKIRQAVLQYRKEKNDAGMKALEAQITASWKVIFPIRQAAAARMEEGRGKQMALRMLEMQQNDSERTLKMMLQQALYPRKPMAPRMPLSEEQQAALMDWEQKVRQAAAAYHAEKNDANLAALKKQITESFDQSLKIRTEVLAAMPDGEEKAKAKDFVEKAGKERDLQIEDEFERLQNQFRQRIMRRGGSRGEGGEGPRGFRGPRGGAPEMQR